MVAYLTSTEFSATTHEFLSFPLLLRSAHRDSDHDSGDNSYRYPPAFETPIETPITTPIETPVETPITTPPPGPTDIVRLDPEEEFTRKPTPDPDLPQAQSSEAPEAAPRPPDGFPRRIGHQETVEYRYDPDSVEFTAQVVESTKPVVTGWDESAPQREERPVGKWDGIPSDDWVIAENQGRAAIPEGVKVRLREKAAGGDPATTQVTMNYDHDLDTGETTTLNPRPVDLNHFMGVKTTRKISQLDDLDKYAQIAERMAEASARSRPPRQRHAYRHHDDVKDGGYKMPTIVITSEPASTRRMGGL